MKHLLLSPLFMIATLMFILPSCNSEDTDVLPANTIFDMVTFDAQTPEGAVFTLQRTQTSPVLTLVAARQQVNTNTFPVGNRMIIAYTPDNGDPNRSGNITLYGGAPVTNGNIQFQTAQATENFKSEKVRLTSAWLTGNYLNFEMRVDCTTEPKNCALYADEATIGTDNPVVYLIFEADDLGSAYWQQLYASFNIEELWDTGADHFTLVVREASSIDGDYLKTFLKNPDAPVEPAE